MEIIRPALITEHELTELASAEFAKSALPGERPNSTFARLYAASENVELRKAIEISRNEISRNATGMLRPFPTRS